MVTHRWQHEDLSMMLEAFHNVYGYQDECVDQAEDDRYCETLGTWKWAWDAATAAEREACAQVATDQQRAFDRTYARAYQDGWDDAALQIASAIRARMPEDDQK